MFLQTKNVSLAGTRQTLLTKLARLTDLVNLKFMGDTPITSRQLLGIMIAAPVIFLAGLLATATILLL